MQNAPAVRTTLPFELAGTLILEDETRSIGTILDRTSQKAYPVRIEDSIPGKAKVIKVEARKVTFINLQNRRNEYVDLPDDGFQPQFSTTGGGTGLKSIEQVSANRFVIPRREIDESLKDLHKVLTEARAIPHFENGQPAGFRLTQIAPGSIYEKLGLKDDDILTGINGESITSDPTKAWNYVSELKSAKQVELSVRRGGKDSVLSYDIQ